MVHFDAAVYSYCESFNSKLRDELLNGEIFYNLKEAKIIIEVWRRRYNTIRRTSNILAQTASIFRAAKYACLIWWRRWSRIFAFPYFIPASLLNGRSCCASAFTHQERATDACYRNCPMAEALRLHIAV